MERRHLSIPLLLPSEGDCESCVARLKSSLLETKGISAAEVDIERSQLVLTFDPAVLPLDALDAQAREAGIHVARQFAHKTLRLEGLDCPDCANTLEKGIRRLEGIVWVTVSLPASRMLVEYDQAAVSPEEIAEQIFAMGYRVVGVGVEAPVSLKYRIIRNRRALATVVCGVLAAGGFATYWLGGAEAALYSRALYLAAVVAGGLPVMRGALRALRARSVDMNVLMSVAVIGAAILGHESEAASVVFLFALGNALEGYTMQKTRRALEGLLKLAPDRARVRRGDIEELVATESVQPGEIFIIRPGERVALDGKVVRGMSSLDESAITGESIPAQKRKGDEVWAGSMNEYGALEVEVTRRSTESTLARILELVESAEAQKTPSQRVIDRFARYYTPAVILTAVGIATVPPLVFGQEFGVWAYRALTLLVVSCPCALVIATPVAFVAALSAAAREGVLVKGGIFLEEIAGLRAVAMDKTGTLTFGEAKVTEVVALNGYKEEEVLRLAASVESQSEHHLARALVAAAKAAKLEILVATEFSVIPGVGARATVLGKETFVGRQEGNQEEIESDAAALANEGKTAVVVTVEKMPIGIVGMEDIPRSEAAQVIGELKELGVSHLTMLTGDNPQTAAAIAERVGLDNFQASLLPDEKVAEVKRLGKEWGKVAMVGDGINDAPALAAATVGVAMGAAGSDVALETADVVLMGDDLSRLGYLLRIGRKTVRIMRQNIAFSILIKFAFLLLAFPGWLTLWLAVIGDTGVSLLVILNSMRLLGREKRKEQLSKLGNK